MSCSHFRPVPLSHLDASPSATCKPPLTNLTNLTEFPRVFQEGGKLGSLGKKHRICLIRQGSVADSGGAKMSSSSDRMRTAKMV
jgi:hypothetical protein